MTGAIHFAMTHSEPGGLREIWNDVSAGLEARGHRTERFVLYPNGDGVQRNHAATEGWHHVLDARAGGANGAAKLFRALVGYLRHRRPAAVVTAMPFANVIVPLAVRAARTGTRVYVSHHSPADTHNPALVRLDAWTGRMREVAAVICVSHAVAASHAGKPAAYRRKLVTIRNALPEAMERAIDRLVGEGASEKVPGRVIALGRLSHQKNYPMLLRAMAHVPEGTLHVVGTGEDEAELRALTETCGVAGRVRFLGQMTRGEALAHAATAQVFAQVSHYEGHSLALIEAARLGLPLVVSQVPVQVEAVTDADGALCGLPVPIGDDEGLGAVLARLLGDPVERDAWARRARALGLAASNRAMIDAYERLLVA